MKVYVVTKAELMSEEIYVSVHPTMKAAEKAIRSVFPNARKDTSLSISFLCKDRNGHESLMFIHPEDI